MERVELLTVEESFQIGPEVIVVPDFSVPDDWKNQAAMVMVEKPGGQQYEANAQFSVTHFNIPDPKISMDKRWRVIVSFPNRKKEELPVGSKILVSPDLKDAILPHDAHERRS